MKYILLLFFVFGINYSFCQEKNFETLGKELATSIVENDSISFFSLILPKEGVIQMFKEGAKGKLKDEEVEIAIKNINENYRDIVSSTYGLSFFNLTTKADIFNLNLKEIKYEVVETEETKNIKNTLAVQGKINHNKFSYFTFYASEYKGEMYLASHQIYLSEINKLEEKKELKKVELLADEKGSLISQGRIDLNDTNAPKKEILNCILNSPIIIGVKENSVSSDNTNNFEFIRGQWQYTYYVNNSSDFAGLVEFKYEFKISDGTINYKYYDFKHFKDVSEFESIGILPYEINAKVLDVFNEKQYGEIISDIYLNQVLAIKRTKQYTDKCFR